MTRRFRFADAVWFRVPLKAVVVGLCAFSILTLWPSLAHGGPDDRGRAIFGLAVLCAFVVIASIFTVAVNDSYVEVDGDALRIRFEAFFNVNVPLRDIVRVAEIDPRPRWRYRFGIATNFADRISCSHGGRLVEIELARPCSAKLWPRRIPVRRFWLAVREHEHDEFVAVLRSIAGQPAEAAAAPPTARAA